MGNTKTAHFDHVVAVLAEEFGWDQTTRDVCRSNLEHSDYANGFPPWFEFICDEPVAANWRLKGNPRQGRYVLRVAYYGDDAERQARAEVITRRLVAP